jgi:hypothetical protein
MRLGGGFDGPGFGAGSTLAVAVKRNAAVFCVDGAVMAKKEIASDESAPTLEALEWTLLGVCRWGQ